MINRFEIIDNTKDLDDGGGRTVIVKPRDGKEATFDVQDDGKTLKVFIQSVGAMEMRYKYDKQYLAKQFEYYALPFYKRWFRRPPQ